MRRLIAAAAGLTVAVAGLVFIEAAPAGAVRTETLVITREQPGNSTFGPIPASFPGTTAAVPEPSDCADATEESALFATCDTVPVKIVKPANLSPFEDFLVTITVEWTPNEDVDGQPVDDIDIYLYDNRQVGKRTNPNSTAWTNLGESATAGYPETVKLFNPELGDYNLVVVNYLGANFDYTVRGVMQVEAFESPFEDLGPAFGSRRVTNSATIEEFAAPVDLSGDETPSPRARLSDTFDASDLGGTLTARTLDEVVLMPDEDFSNFGDSDFESALAAPRVPEGLRSARLAAVPRDASAASVAFWLVFLPLVAIALLIVLLVRRNRDAFEIKTA